MSSVQELITEITSAREKAKSEGLTVYETRSQKDELAIMRAMMNDTEYKVGVYGNNGLEGYYCPAQEFRNTISNIISNSTGIPVQEAQHRLDSYEFKNADAQGMINFSKEFINTYLQTGRKLPLGGRETSNVSLKKKTIPAGTMLYPSKVNDKTESKEVFVDSYDSVRVYGSCPAWIKNKKG